MDLSTFFFKNFKKLLENRRIVFQFLVRCDEISENVELFDFGCKNRFGNPLNSKNGQVRDQLVLDRFCLKIEKNSREKLKFDR
ncbi:unnamed protein product [Caenorhabditis angaria]|uniref:Uncharacterized protein n=1 Tax=Caenorhabditis angaria TaxID=860376 RepID=A0A9P1IK49_9PELO|nr:unnamed protein product [Caenorhabditis angaria]